MTLGNITGTLLIDLTDSGSFATDLTAYWKRENGFALMGLGRNQEFDAADMASFTTTLDNKTGRFSPKNTGGAYYPNWTAYKRMRVTLVFNAVTYTLFTGVLTDIKVGPEAGEQLCEITLRDFMYYLSRTDIRRPLMRDQFTGVIINRLLDDVEGAEGREKVTNPSFQTDLATYSTFGTATITRMTDDKILEGPAACQVITSAANSGLLWTAPTDLGGLTVRAVAYCKPERDADIGANVRIELHDEVGLVQGSGNVPLSTRDKWTRMSVEGTYAGTSEFVKLSAPISGTQFRVGALHVTTSFGIWLRTNIDDGQSQLKQYSYHRGSALPAIQEVRENELGGLFYFDGSGVPHFEDRTFRWRTTRSLTAQSTFDERGNMDYSESGDDRVKAVVLDYPHYVDGEPGTVVWESDRVIQLPPGVTTAVEADYGGGLVRDTITPVAGTDYTINAAGDGSGAPMLGSVTFSFIDFGAGAQASFTNSATSIVYLRSFQIRGTPVRLAADTSPARYTATGGPALASTKSIDYQLNGSEPAVQSWAQYLGDRHSTQRYRLAVRHSAAFPQAHIEVSGTPSSDMVAILARTVSDRVTHTNDNLPMSLKLTAAAHYIDSVDLRLSGGENSNLEAAWRLSEVDADYWVLEEAGSSLGTNTVLAA